MTIFTVPRGQARALFASLLPHAGRQSEDTPDYGRVRFAPDPDELVAWTIDGATAAAGYIDITHHDDHEADLFDLSTGALKAALAVFRGPSDKDARQMWADQDLRITVDADSVTLEEVEDILDGRSLTVERWVTQGEDRYPDVPRTLAVHATAPDLAEASVSADALARFIPSAKAWDAQLLLTITGEPRRLEVRIGARLIGLCPARRRDDDDVRDRIRWDEGWDTRLTRHLRTERPPVVDEAAQALRDALRDGGGLAVVSLNGRRLDLPADALTDDPDADEDGDR